MREIALFDMDRTLVRAHTSRLYTKYRRQRGEVGALHSLRVMYWLFLYSTGFVDAPTIAQRALAEYRGKSLEAHRAELGPWFAEYVLPHVSEVGRRVVEAHRRRGDALAIVTGASRYVTEPLLQELGIEHLVATEVEIDEGGRFTGQVVPPLAFGKGKLELTLALLERLGIAPNQATFYTDSITDLPLLEAVGRPVVVNPDLRLRLVARRRGWPVLDW